MKKLFIILYLLSSALNANNDYYLYNVGPNRALGSNQMNTSSLMRHSLYKMVPGASLSLKDSRLLGQNLMANPITAPFFCAYSYLIMLGLTATSYIMLTNLALILKNGTGSLFDLGKFCCNRAFKTEYKTDAQSKARRVLDFSISTAANALCFGTVVLFGVIPLKYMVASAEANMHFFIEHCHFLVLRRN